MTDQEGELMKSPRIMLGTSLVAVAILGAACSSGSSSTSSTTTAPPSTTAGSGAAAGAPIKIALITSLTGQAGPQFSESPQGFNAAIGVINAAGGANGHKIIGTVYDDKTDPSAIVTQVQKAISDGNVGIVSDTPLMFLAAKYPMQAGIPVTGGSFDGFEWGTPGYENMFASDTGSLNPSNPPSTGTGVFMKAHGGTVAGAWGYGISPQSLQAANNAIWSAEAAGLKKGVLDTAVPFGSVDFTSAALAAKTAGVNAVEGTMDVNSGVALTVALKQAGVNVKVNVFPAGYDPSIIKTPSWSSVQGAYFASEFRPVTLPNEGTKAISAALLKYANRPVSQFPSFAIYESYLGMLLMAKGIEVAGDTPTSAGIIKNLRQYSGWTGTGLLAYNIDYATTFGHGPNPSCSWYLKAETNGFVNLGTKPVCGTTISGKSGQTAP